MILTRFTTARFLAGLFLFASASICLVVPLTPTTAQEASSDSNTATPSPTPSPTPIPPSAIVEQSELVTARLKEIQSFLREKPQNVTIRGSIPELVRQLDTLSTETNAVLEARPTLDDLKNLERDWQGPGGTVDGWKSDLAGQTTEIDKRIEELRSLKELWQRSLDAMTAEPDVNANAESTVDELVPEELLQRVRETIASIAEIQKASESRRSLLLSLQSQISDLETRINDASSAIKDRRANILSRLFVREEPAIWNVSGGDGRSMSSQISEAMTGRAAAFREYAADNRERFVLHGFVLLLFITVIAWARKRVGEFAEQDAKVVRAVNIFRHPIAVGFVLSVFFSSLIYPQAPRMLTTMLGAAAMIPVVIILRRLVDKPFFVIVCVLVGFYFFDRIREISADIPLLSRVQVLAEMLAAVLLLTYFVRSKRIANRVAAGKRRVFDILRRIAPFAIAIFAAAFLANLIGAVNLSNVIGNGVLRSIYVALVIYTAAEVIDGLTIFALRVRPLSGLGMVKTNRKVITARVRQAVRWLGVVVWAVVTLTLFSIRDLVFSFLSDVFSAELNVGSIKLTLGHLLAFVIAVWVAVLISRFIRFLLEEDVYPRVDIGTGVSYAISTIVHYLVLTAGLLIAVAALGFELSQFAIIAGAVGIGVGFGLQNIINNFVSGIILLFERPVKVGDMVQIGEHQGTLSQIGLRASVLRKVDGSDVIVPNSQLISDEVINWTMSDDKRRLDIPVGVAYGTDPAIVIKLLTEVSVGKPNVMTEPAPRALFIGFGDNSLDFELRAWTDDSDEWVALRSEIVSDIYASLTNAGIEIPFPQRDLHLRSVDGETIKDIRGK
ncbi:MAG: mechanosensitive ion channel domain-containing protein [Pyrinomonadaceae bacterium]